MPEGLDPVAAPADLYLARGAEVEPYRPILQGDVFQGVTIPGVDEEDGENLALVIQHPCSMRQGVRLRSHLAVLRVKPFTAQRPRSWALGHFPLMPLEALRSEAPGTSYAAHFELIGRVPSETLRLSARIACLSELGISILQQRQVHYLTRAKIEREKLAEVSRPFLEEAELQEEWNREVLEGIPVDRVEPRLAEEAEAFDKVLSRKATSGDRSEPLSLREKLLQVDQRPAVRRAVRVAMKERLTDRSSAEGRSSDGAPPTPAG